MQEGMQPLLSFAAFISERKNVLGALLPPPMCLESFCQKYFRIFFAQAFGVSSMFLGARASEISSVAVEEAWSLRGAFLSCQGDWSHSKCTILLLDDNLKSNADLTAHNALKNRKLLSTVTHLMLRWAFNHGRSLEILRYALHAFSVAKITTAYYDTSLLYIIQTVRPQDVK